MSKYKNRGVLIGKRDTDFMAGALGALTYEEINPSGDWTKYLPTGEKQRATHISGGQLETYACVSYSALNSIETQIKFLAGRELNFSDRYTAKMSGTMTNGNYFYKVADSIRKDGCVAQEDWPSNGAYTWDTYYSEIPQSVKDKGLKFLEDYEISYEWIPFSKAEMLKHIKHAPLQIAVLNNTHAVLNFLTTQDIYKYFDSYEPYIKETTSLTSPFKIVLKLKNKTMRLEQVTGQKDTWAIDQFGVKHLIINYQTFEEGKKMGLWTGDILQVAAINNPEGFILALFPNE